MTVPAPHAGSITVIVPTYNRAGYIAECLHSLLAQTVPALEILVVDDGSEDDTAGVVAAFGSRMTYVRQANEGKARAVNRGLALARGDWIWIMDDDDVALPEANQHRLAALASTPDAGFVYGPHHLGTDGRDGKVRVGRLVQPPAVDPSQFFLTLMKSCFFHLGTTLVRREHYLALNGLDPALQRGQDYDFQIRLARIARPVRCREPAFVFRQHEGVRGTQATRHDARSRGAVFMRYSQAIGQKLLVDVPLGEYLVPAQPGAAADLQPPARALALVNRMEVMGNHGCVTELMEDLEALLRLRGSAGQPLQHADRVGIARAMRAGWACEASKLDPPAWRDHVSRLKQQPGGTAALRALAAGAYTLARSHPGTPVARLGTAGLAARLMLSSLP